MALEFLTDAEIGDCELVIRLDLDGLQTLMRTLEAAMDARLERISLKGPDGGTADAGATAGAFGRVSVVLVGPAPEDGGDAPPPPAGGSEA